MNLQDTEIERAGRAKRLLVDVDGRALELALLVELVEVVHTGGGLLRDTADVLDVLRVLLVNESSQVTTVLFLRCCCQCPDYFF